MRTLPSPLALAAVTGVTLLCVVAAPGTAHASDGAGTPAPGAPGSGTPIPGGPPIEPGGGGYELPDGLPGDVDPSLPCGTPGKAPVFDTIEHPASVVHVVDASHPEWIWTLTTTTTEAEYVPGDGVEGEPVWQDAALPAPEGHVASGATRETTDTQTSDGHLAAAPGEGWVADPASRITVEDAGHDEQIPAWVEDFIVVDGTPAGPVCPVTDDGTGGTGGTGGGTDGVVDGTDGGTDGEVGEVPGEIGEALSLGGLEGTPAAPAAAPAVARTPIAPAPAPSTPVVVEKVAATVPGPDQPTDPGLLGLGVVALIAAGGAVAWRAQAG